jgi:hypothetical protein
LPGLPEIIHVAVGIGTGVVTKIVADWLYQRIRGKGRTIKVRVNRSIVEVTPEGLERGIREAIDIRVKDG